MRPCLTVGHIVASLSRFAVSPAYGMRKGGCFEPAISVSLPVFARRLERHMLEGRANEPVVERAVKKNLSFIKSYLLDK